MYLRRIKYNVYSSKQKEKNDHSLAAAKNGKFRGFAITAIVLGTMAVGLYAIIYVVRIANAMADMDWDSDYSSY